MSNEKSFLDDNGLQRLWQKITAAINESGSTVESFLVGDIKASLNENQSSNWLKCDGQPVKISDYQELGKILGSSVYIRKRGESFPNPSDFYSGTNQIYINNELCRYNHASYYPIVNADENSLSIIRIKDHERSFKKIATISLPDSAQSNLISNIIQCWNAYNIVWFSKTNVSNNVVTLTYYIVRAETLEALEWTISGPHTLNLSTNCSANTSPSVFVSSDGNNLLFSVTYGDSNGNYIDLGIVPNSISSARLIHLLGPLDRYRRIIVEYIGDRYFLSEMGSPIYSPSQTIENKIPFFRDIDSISIEYLDLSLPSPYQLSAFSFYGFKGVLKVGDKFRAYLSTREDIQDSSSIKYVTSIYMYESSNLDFTDYTIKTIYRNINTSTPSWDYLVDTGGHIFLVDIYSTYISMVLVDKDDPTKTKAGDILSWSNYSNKVSIWPIFKPFIEAYNEHIAAADQLLYYGSNTNNMLFGIFRVSIGDPDNIIALPSISKDTQGYRYIKAK